MGRRHAGVTSYALLILDGSQMVGVLRRKGRKTIMSFEGRYQILCPKGHYRETCVYDFHEDWDGEGNACGAKVGEGKFCGTREVAWKNIVDDTNEWGEGAVNDLVEKTPAVVKMLEGYRFCVKDTEFEIPEGDHQ